MSNFENVITIEENAQYLLNSSAELQTDANISSAIIYQNVKKYKRGYQPLLTSPIPHDEPTSTFDFPPVPPHHQDEDVLLNPNKYKSTMSIGSTSHDQSNGFDEDNNLDTKASKRPLSSPVVRITSSSSPKQSSKSSDAMVGVDWSTANWSSIYLHFHSVEHEHYIYPCVMIIGMIFIVAIMFMELFLAPPATFVFCRYLNWVLLILFSYVFAFVISYSKVSTKRWCVLRDYLYVVFWVNSLLCILIGLIMKCLPFTNTKRGIEDNLKYVNCANNDDECDGYKDKYGISQLEMDILIIVAHSIPFIYCITMSIMFTHKDSFQKSCREILIVMFVAIFWFFWNIFSYVATDKWTYKGIDKLYHNNKDNDTDVVILSMLAILIVILCIMFILYCFSYMLHHRCRLCEHNYSRYFKPKTLAAKMEEKKKELNDMPDLDDAFSSGIAL